jgi:hypothetical protein
MEARQAASEMEAAYARPSLAETVSGQIDLRRLLETILHNLNRMPKVRVYDPR